MRATLVSLLGITFICGCQPYRFEQPTQPASGSGGRQPATAQPTKSPRGNPAFYEVFGQRYYVLDSADGYEERGVASWYGRKFHGNPTANGEKYDMHGVSAAHKGLPLPTWVEVTNLKNGRKLTLRVNDRGPFVHNRLIDLSYGAALKLDMVESGTTLVNVRALGTPALAPALEPKTSTATPAPSQPTPTLADITRELYVQVGAFGQQENAERLMNRLSNDGLKDVFVLSDLNVEPALHRVRVGPVKEVDQYDGIVAQLAALGYADTHLVSED
jgi:rare lipoprotein A